MLKKHPSNLDYSKVLILSLLYESKTTQESRVKIHLPEQPNHRISHDLMVYVQLLIGWSSEVFCRLIWKLASPRILLNHWIFHWILEKKKVL